MTLKEDNKLAEFTGICLGDGHIPEDMYKITVTSDRIEEVEYIKYTKEMMEGLFNKPISIIPHNDSNATDLVIYGKEVVRGLVEKGLTPGNKVEKQADIPEWISKKIEYQKGCLRGLTDTDGSIFVKKAQKSIKIGFQNHSKPLVEGFRDICQALDIKTGNVTTYQRIKNGKTYYQHDLLIAGKSEVCKFINQVKPQKWEYRSETIGLTLISLKDPQKRELIERELNILYPDKRVHYHTEYKNKLKELCEKHGYNVDKKSIISAIREALINKHTNKISPDGEEIIDKLKRKL